MRGAVLDMSVVKLEDGSFVGINLGHDFASQHENGIPTIERSFGIVRGKVEVIPPTLRFFPEIGGSAWLLFDPIPIAIPETPTLDHLNRMLEVWKPEECTISTAWDKRSFGIRMANGGEGGAAILGQLYDALLKKDALIFVSPGVGPFAERGLVIAIHSRVSNDVLTKLGLKIRLVATPNNVDLSSVNVDITIGTRRSGHAVTD